MDAATRLLAVLRGHEHGEVSEGVVRESHKGI